MLYVMWLGKESEKAAKEAGIECPYELGEKILVRRRTTESWCLVEFSGLAKCGDVYAVGHYTCFSLHRKLHLPPSPEEVLRQQALQYTEGEVIRVRLNPGYPWVCQTFRHLGKHSPDVVCGGGITWSLHKPLTPTEKGII